MQGVAAKNDASYDLSRARASVTGQTTIAASTAATPMTPPPSEKPGLVKDLIVILGLPALLLSAVAWYYWETIFPAYRAPSEDAHWWPTDHSLLGPPHRARAGDPGLGAGAVRAVGSSACLSGSGSLFQRF